VEEGQLDINLLSIISWPDQPGVAPIKL